MALVCYPGSVAMPMVWGRGELEGAGVVSNEGGQALPVSQAAAGARTARPSHDVTHRTPGESAGWRRDSGSPGTNINQLCPRAQRLLPPSVWMSDLSTLLIATAHPWWAMSPCRLEAALMSEEWSV